MGFKVEKLRKSTSKNFIRKQQCFILAYHLIKDNVLEFDPCNPNSVMWMTILKVVMYGSNDL